MILMKTKTHKERHIMWPVGRYLTKQNFKEFIKRIFFSSLKGEYFSKASLGLRGDSIGNGKIWLLDPCL